MYEPWSGHDDVVYYCEHCKAEFVTQLCARRCVDCGSGSVKFLRYRYKSEDEAKTKL